MKLLIMKFPFILSLLLSYMPIFSAFFFRQPELVRDSTTHYR